jgi:hypothetical protein
MTEPRNADNWAKPIDQFHVEEVAEGVYKGNVEGRKPTGPLQGFGQLWQKTYEVSIPGPTPEGHPWAAIITFSAYEAPTTETKANIHLLVRANDPLYEASFHIYTSRLEDKIWTYTLTQLAGHFGSEAPVESQVLLIDKKRQWNQFGNLWKNSAVRTLLRQDRR